MRRGVGPLQRLGGDPGGERRDPLGLLAIASELLVEQDRRQPVDPRLERGLAILVPEESRIAQPRRQHALGVARDDFRLLRLHVGDREKRRLQPSLVVHHREVVLVMDHRRRQHFFRQLEELDRKVARHDRRVFDEIGHFLQERRLCRDEAADAATELAGVRLELAPDLRFALRAIEDDEVLEQTALVVVERLDLDRAPRAAARRQEAVTVGVRAGPDVLHVGTLRDLGAADDERHDATAVHQHEPADRTREHELALAVLEVGVPPHLLRKREVAQQAAHDVGEHVDRGLATLAHAVGEVGALGVRLRSSVGTSTPYFFAKPTAAGVGSPSGLNAADTGGPVTSSSKSVCRSASFATRAVSRRGVLKPSAGDAGVSRSVLQARVEVRRHLRRSGPAASSRESPRTRSRSAVRDPCRAPRAARLCVPPT